MATWPRHIERFKRQYDKAFTRHRLFGTDIMDRIHKQVQVFLHSCNTTFLEDVEMGALAEFRYMQRWLDRGEWITTPPFLGRDAGSKSQWAKEIRYRRTGAVRKGADQAGKTCDRNKSWRMMVTLTCNHVSG